MSATQFLRRIDLARSSFAKQLGTCARVGLALSLAALTSCSADESVLERSVLDDDPACVGTQGYALGDAPPVFTLQDIGYTLTVLGQLQAAVTPLVAMGLPPEPLFTGSWTNWSSETDIRNALAKLGVMRGILDKANLWDLYAGNIHPALNVAPVPGVHPGTATMPAASCDEAALTNRTIDGTCNDLAQPSMGARGIRFGRNIMPYLPHTVTNPDGTTSSTLVKNPSAQADLANLMNPSPREVSRHLFTAPNGGQQKVPFLNMFAAAWIQFQVHDWFDHGESNPLDGFTIPLASDDPFVKKFKIASMYVPKTKPDASRTPIDNVVGLPPTFQNDVTHWWDGSQIYGSDAATAQRLRSGVGGKLKVDANGLLPKAADGFDDTGMRRNWWIGLAIMHNVFAKEHNAIADMLAAKYPNWTDQQLYDKARMINSALIVKIHTVEWTPAILPNKALEVGMNANWYGLEKFIQWGTPDNQPLPPLVFKQAFGIPDSSWPDVKPIVYGVAGGDRDLKKNPFLAQVGVMQDVPFTLTEEFVSVYRMHPLLPGKFPVRTLNGPKVADYTMNATRNAGARNILETHPMQDLLFTMGHEHPGALVLQNYPQFIQELDIPLIGKMDMGTVDILRDRERGIPRYNAFRANLRMKPVASFEELTGNNATLVAALKKVYGSDAGAINRMDALVGTLAEGIRPACYGFGETLFQVFTVMATRRIQADRFLTTDYTPAVYTPEGIDWVEGNSFKSVLLRHYPELASTGLAGVKNAFFPWD
jgi:hypothetical protein